MIIDDVSRKVNDKFSAYIHHTSTATDTDCRNWFGSTLQKVVLHSDYLARDAWGRQRKEHVAAIAGPRQIQP
jgi:hypothetical protein